jgi:1-deoxyxylulose-5-phosphate synthase
MDHVRLGRTGLQVSRLCLGTMTFGYQCDEPTSVAILNAAADNGITFLDTADVYPLGGGLETVGRTEEIVGRWMAGRRGSVILATKCVGRMGPRPWQQGASRRHILDAVEGSLRRLGTDYIDLYQMHSFDPNVTQDETLGALDQLVMDGKVRYIGCSNYLASQLARGIGRSETLGLARFDSVQPRYNLLYRNGERELFPLCLEDGVGVIPYNPLAGGFLTGKHRPGTPTEGTRFTLGTAAQNYQNRYWNERDFATVEVLRSVAADAGMSLTQLAVAWCLAQPAVTSPIIGASRPDQLDEPVSALDCRLEGDLIARLDELTTDYRHHPAQR